MLVFAVLLVLAVILTLVLTLWSSRGVSGVPFGPCSPSVYSIGKTPTNAAAPPTLLREFLDAVQAAHVPYYCELSGGGDTTSGADTSEATLLQVCSLASSFPLPLAGGNGPIAALPCSGWSTFPFSGNMGQLEWILGFCADPGTAGPSPSSCFFYLSRVTVLPGNPDTVRFVWGHIVTSKARVYTEGPVCIVGKCSVSSAGFTLHAGVPGDPDGIILDMSVTTGGEDGNDHDSRVVKITRTDKHTSLVISIDCPASPIFNGPGGCAPCAIGVGTSYSSVPACTWDVQYSDNQNQNGLIDPQPLCNKTIGWIDHQTEGTKPSSSIGRLILALSGKSAGLETASYMWVILHLRERQYMFTFTAESVGDATEIDLPCILAREYSAPEGSEYKELDGMGRVKGTLNPISSPEHGGPVNFPTSLAFQGFTGNNTSLPSEFLVDLKDFGGAEQYFRDNSGNAHMFASGVLRNSYGLAIGTAMVECNRFQTPEVYAQNFNALLPHGYVRWKVRYRFEKILGVFVSFFVGLLALDYAFRRLRWRSVVQQETN